MCHEIITIADLSNPYLWMHTFGVAGGLWFMGIYFYEKITSIYKNIQTCS